MPYNGSGGFSYPSNSFNPAIGGTVIASADNNSILQDAETAFSMVQTVDGQSVITANLPMAGFKHTGVNPNSGSTSATEYLASGVAQSGVAQDAGSTGGTSTAYTATLSPAITAYADKQFFRVVLNANCGNNPTINFNTLGAKKLYIFDGTSLAQPQADDLLSGFALLLRYDASLDTAAGAFLITNFVPRATQAQMVAGTAKSSFATPLGAAQAIQGYPATQNTFAEQGSSPSTPSSGQLLVYARDDGTLRYKNDAGTEITVGAQNLVLLDTVSANNTSGFLTGANVINSTAYSYIQLVLVDILPATNDVSFEVQVRLTGGAFQTTNYSSVAGFDGSTLATSGKSASTSGVIMNNTNANGRVASDSDGGLSGVVRIWPLTSGKFKKVAFDGGYVSDTVGAMVISAFGYYTGATTEVDLWRLSCSSGNIASGTVYVYGIKNT